jgi:hypothetical protein
VGCCWGQRRIDAVLKKKVERDQLMNLPVFIGQMLEEAKRFLKKNDCMENIYI